MPVPNRAFFFVDLQNVNITLRILFRPKPQTLPDIYMNLGEDYDERVLPSITTEVLKAVVVRASAGYSLWAYNNNNNIEVNKYLWSKRVLEPLLFAPPN